MLADYHMPTNFSTFDTTNWQSPDKRQHNDASLSPPPLTTPFSPGSPASTALSSDFIAPYGTIGSTGTITTDTGIDWDGVDLSQSDDLFSTLNDMNNSSQWLMPQVDSNAPKFSHNRDSSASSIGSAPVDPASPYNQSIANPQIVLSDSFATNYNMPYYEEQQANAYSAMNKNANLGAGSVAYGMAQTRPFNASLHPQNMSATSSIASSSPSNQFLDQAQDEAARRRNGEHHPTKSTPGIDLSQQINGALFDFNSPFIMDSECSQILDDLGINSSAYSGVSDDYYGYTPTSAPPQQTYGQRIQTGAAGFAPAQGLSPMSSNFSRDHSPMAQTMGNLPFNTIQATQRNTISPKDNFSDADESGVNYSLFQQSAPGAGFPAHMNMQHPNTAVSQAGLNSYLTSASVGAMPQAGNPSSFARNTAAPRAPSPKNSSPTPAETNRRPVVPIPRVVGDLASLSEPVPGTQRKGFVVNDGGTYTCTYHGCVKRFDTPGALQKHKRESHRQVNAMTTARRTDHTTVGALNTQSGTHTCNRINPSTGKPCNTQFSRPYDLTRHEDTIHNARKQKVRCNMCTDDKLFSRADALTRHFRVCHPEINLNTRRGGGR